MNIQFSSRIANKWPMNAVRNLADVPADTPLVMPLQDFAQYDEKNLNKPQPNAAAGLTSPQRMKMRRAVLFLVTVMMTAFAVIEMIKPGLADGISALEVALIVLFAPLFAWITFSFVSAFAGFIQLIRGSQSSSVLARIMTGEQDARSVSGRTALLIPIYNEDVDAVFSRLERMVDDLEAAGAGESFDVFILSDTNDEAIQQAEHQAAQRIRFTDGTIPVYYRHRQKNIERKPGNIAEWVRRFGGAYDYMLILDADSLMSGDVMHRLTVAMDENPDIGLIQTVPKVVEGQTIFARWQQFAARLYGPAPTAGLIWWSGSEGSFWGHNAIVRVKAFAQSCGLPRLRGPAPFGGDIMSHDIVEAALLRRNGWAVHMVDVPAGSYEEYPPTLIDFAIRDRRWCQGNLQHLQLLNSKGLHAISRLHLLMGASAYFTSPLWALLIGVTLVAGVTSGHADGLAGPLQSFSGWLLWATIILLFGPKLLSLVWTLAHSDRRAAFGGGRRLLAGVAVDVPLGILFAPIIMVTQCVMVLALLAGRRTGWSAQRREVEGISLAESLAFCRSHLVAAVALVGVCIFLPGLSLWMAPVIAGLVFAPFLVGLSSRPDLGQKLRHIGVLLTPEERKLPKLKPTKSAARGRPLFDSGRWVERSSAVCAVAMPLLPIERDIAQGRLSTVRHQLLPISRRERLGVGR